MTWRKCTENYFTTPNTELLPDSVEEKRLLQKSSKHINDKPPCCASILETMARTVQMLVVRWVITHIGGSCPGEAFGMSWTKTSVCVCVGVWEEYSLRSLMALSLVVDRWQRCLSVKLQSFSQGLPDLLCVWQHTDKAQHEMRNIVYRLVKRSRLFSFL